MGSTVFVLLAQLLVFTLGEERGYDKQRGAGLLNLSFQRRLSPSYSHSFVGKRAADLSFPSTDLQDDNGLPAFWDLTIPLESLQESQQIQNSIKDRDSLDFFGPSLDDFQRIQARAVDRYGHSFVGKRSSYDDLNDIADLSDMEFIAKRLPGYGHSFVGKRVPGYGHAFVGKRNLDDYESEIAKRGYGHRFVGKRAGYEHAFVGKRSPGYGHAFVGKRGYGHSFVGKRQSGYGHAFVGKRVPGYGHAFVGKRVPEDGDENEQGYGHDFIGKRQSGYGHAFVGKRNLDFDKKQYEHAFVGKRSADMEHSIRRRSVDELSDYQEAMDYKRQAGYGHAFVGKRSNGYGHAFVGKRVPGYGHAFVGKRDPGYGHAFVGKRYQHAFVGKRVPGYGHAFVGKRYPSYEHAFVGKRDSNDKLEVDEKRGYGHAFVGKRTPGYGHAFVGKRNYGHAFVGKRVPGSYGHAFVGKRVPGYGHAFVGKRDDMDADQSLHETDFSNEDLLTDGTGDLSKLFEFYQQQEEPSIIEVDENASTNGNNNLVPTLKDIDESNLSEEKSSGFADEQAIPSTESEGSEQILDDVKEPIANSVVSDTT